MTDELKIRRQTKCARSRDGHDFDQDDHGTCKRCELTVR